MRHHRPVRPIVSSRRCRAARRRRRSRTTRSPGSRSTAAGASVRAGRSTARPDRPPRRAGSIRRRGSTTLRDVERRDPGRRHAGQLGHQRLLRRRRARLAGADQLQDGAGPGRCSRWRSRSLLVWFLLRRTRWDEVEPRPIRRRRRAGQIVRVSAGGVPARAARVRAASGSCTSRRRCSPDCSERCSTGSRSSTPCGRCSASPAAPTSSSALLIGSLVNLAAFVVVNSMVADYMEREQHGIDGRSGRPGACGPAGATCSAPSCGRTRSCSLLLISGHRLPDRRVPARSVPVRRPGGDARGPRRPPRAAAQRTARATADGSTRRSCRPASTGSCS